DRDDDRDDDREPRPVDENRRDHCVAFDSLVPVPPSSSSDGAPARPPVTAGVPAAPCGEIGGGGLAGAGDTASPGRTRCTPSLTTCSPSLSPLVMTAVVGVDWPSWMGRRCALFCASTT